MKLDTGSGLLRHLLVVCCGIVLSMGMLSGCAVAQTQFLSSLEIAETSGKPESSVTGAESSTAEETAVSTVTGPAKIYVYVCGAVKNPGVYELREEARVYEALEAAGGFTNEAAKESVNQARLLTDGEELYVPDEDEAASWTIADAGTVSGQGTAADTQDGKININTADAAALTTLTGIGETKAASIIAWREENGAFTSIEDIKKVDGIADKTYEKIKDEITVN